MLLFEGLDPRDGDSSISQAVRVLVSRLHILQMPRSLAELRLDEDDFERLCDWSEHVTGADLDEWLGSAVEVPDLDVQGRVIRHEAIGLLLILAASEVSRRTAREGLVWPAVRDAYSPSARRALFDASGQPDYDHKDAIERAAQKFGLRHVFGQTGTQSWYVSIYLQFGFTRRGISRLPLWLAGHPVTESIEGLLLSEQASETFRDLWASLRSYRQNNISKAKAAQMIDESPWVLPGWRGELLAAATSRMDLGTVSRPQAPGEAAAEAPFISEPILRWDPPMPPVLVASVINLVERDLDADRYDVLINDEVASQIIRQPDGSYVEYDSITVALVPELVAALRDPDGEIVECQQLTMWDASDEVAVFDMTTGKSKDAWMDRMLTTKPYALVSASDLAVAPSPAQTMALCEGRYKIHLLPTGWDEATKVLLDDSVLWQPVLATETVSPPPLVDLTILPMGSVEVGSRVSLFVKTPPNLNLDGLRLDHRPLDFTLENGAFKSEEIPLTPDLLLSSPRLFAILRSGAQTLVNRIPVPFAEWAQGVLEYTDGRWLALSEDDRLTTTEGASALFKLCIPAPLLDDISNYALMEGHTFLTRAWSRPKSIKGLAGYGQSLSLRKGPYNAEPPLLQVAQEVAFDGLIEFALPMEDRISISIRHPVEPSENHLVVVWAADGELEYYDGERVAGDESLWTVSWHSSSPPSAVGIAYDGSLIGAYFFPSHPDFSVAVTDTASALRVASLLRWFHAPICSRSMGPALASLFKHWPAEVLAGWLTGLGLPRPLAPRALSDSWLGAIRDLIRESTLEARIGRLFSLLMKSAEARGMPADSQEACFYALRLVRELSPFVLASLGKHILSNAGAGGEAAKAWLMNGAVGLSGTVNPREVANEMTKLVHEAAEIMDVDPNFLTVGIINRVKQSAAARRPLTLLDQSNVLVAMNVRQVRECLAIGVLVDL